MIRRMTRADIPAGMKLKAAAGWNQTEQDWANVLELEPSGCWVYEVSEDSSAVKSIAGSTTAVCYGQDLAWIGMVLVLPKFRGRGIARALMEHALRFLDQRGVRCVKLDATDMGRPLYVKLGFEDETAIERWGTVVPADVSMGETEPHVTRLSSIESIAGLDQRAFGVDRRGLLQLLMRCFPGEGHALPGGYLMARPGSNACFLGPCVAERLSDARRLIRTALATHKGQRVFWDLLPENEAARELALELGFVKKRSLVRMALSGGDCPQLNRASDLNLLFATAGFEYG